MAFNSDPAGADPSGELDRPIAQAAALLAGARFALVAGLGTDVDGVRAALALAERLRGAIDHAGGDVLAEEMRVLADAGQMTTTPAEARHRADLVVILGAAALRHAEAVALFDDAHPLYPWRTERRVILAGLGREAPNDLGTATAAAETLATDPARIGALVAALRAAVNGRAVAAGGPGLPTAAEIAAAAEMLRQARFGVVVYDPAELGALGIEQVQGLVKDLNVGTRFTALPRPAPLGARVAAMVAAWTTGFPLRLGFGRGYPEYDAWRFSAERLVTAGEADALLWLAPLGPALPAWAPGERTVALVAPGTAAATAAAVAIEVGVPGLDHGGVLYDARRDGFAWRAAAAPTARPSAAAVIGRIAARLDGAAPC